MDDELQRGNVNWLNREDVRAGRKEKMSLCNIGGDLKERKRQQRLREKKRISERGPLRTVTIEEEELRAEQLRAGIRLI